MTASSENQRKELLPLSDTKCTCASALGGTSTQNSVYFYLTEAIVGRSYSSVAGSHISAIVSLHWRTALYSKYRYLPRKETTKHEKMALETCVQNILYILLAQLSGGQW